VSDERYSKRPLLKLIADLPRLAVAQVKNEFDQFTREMVAKLKHAGVGIGLLAGAAFFGLFLLAVLIAAAILGLATVLPGWLAALIVAVILLIIVLVLALVGIRQLKRGMPPAPTQTITSVKKDVDAIKGIGKRTKR
jgi:uncharacterized membrane protein